MMSVFCFQDLNFAIQTPKMYKLQLLFRTIDFFYQQDNEK